LDEKMERDDVRMENRWGKTVVNTNDGA